MGETELQRRALEGATAANGEELCKPMANCIGVSEELRGSE